MTLPEREAHQQPTAVPRRHIRKVTVGSITTTILLSVSATLLGRRERWGPSTSCPVRHPRRVRLLNGAVRR
jgi:hypothetical protein